MCQASTSVYVHWSTFIYVNKMLNSNCSSYKAIMALQKMWIKNCSIMNFLKHQSGIIAWTVKWGTDICQISFKMFIFVSKMNESLTGLEWQTSKWQNFNFRGVGFLMGSDWIFLDFQGIFIIQILWSKNSLSGQRFYFNFIEIVDLEWFIALLLFYSIIIIIF